MCDALHMRKFHPTTANGASARDIQPNGFGERATVHTAACVERMLPTSQSWTFCNPPNSYAAVKRLLRLLYCDEVQGYLFSKPVPREIFETRFLAHPDGYQGAGL
jgi:hypothetical protein